MEGFEGYVGIRIWDGQMVENVLLGIILFLVIFFAILFYRNIHQFIKMLSDVVTISERNSLFDSSTGDDRIFSFFMSFQALLLSALALYGVLDYYGVAVSSSVSDTLRFLLANCAIIMAFQILRKVIVWLFFDIFFTRGAYTLFCSGAKAVTGTFGTLLYVPVIWLLFVGSYKNIAIGLLVLFYVLSRLVIFYKIVRLFYSKKDDFLFLFVYLCGQEILPIYFMYKGIMYLYKFIEVINLWH